MRITWQQLEGIELIIWTSKIEWTSIQTSLQNMKGGPGPKVHAGPTRFWIPTSANQFFLSIESTAPWGLLITKVQRSTYCSNKCHFVMDQSWIQESCLAPQWNYELKVYGVWLACGLSEPSLCYSYNLQLYKLNHISLQVQIDKHIFWGRWQLFSSFSRNFWRDGAWQIQLEVPR